MTIGMLVTGSIISPRIFISTSMLLVYRFAREGIGAAARHANLNVFSEEIISVIRSGMGEIQRAVPRSSAGPQSERFVTALHIYFFHGADQRGVLPDLNGPLPLLHDGETPRFLFFRNVIAHLKRGGVRPLRIFEAEDRVVLNLVEQVQ